MSVKTNKVKKYQISVKKFNDNQGKQRSKPIKLFSCELELDYHGQLLKLTNFITLSLQFKFRSHGKWTSESLSTWVESGPFSFNVKWKANDWKWWRHCCDDADWGWWERLYHNDHQVTKIVFPDMRWCGGCLWIKIINYSLLFKNCFYRHEVMWRMLGQIPNSRLGKLSRWSSILDCFENSCSH